jgi:hypothetical protein
MESIDDSELRRLAFASGIDKAMLGDIVGCALELDPPPDGNWRDPQRPDAPWRIQAMRWDDKLFVEILRIGDRVAASGLAMFELTVTADGAMNAGWLGEPPGGWTRPGSE